jgi:hypothetical protein
MEFRISWAALSTLCALTLLACVLAVWPRVALAAAVGVPVVAFEALLLLRFKVRINEEGVLLYGRNWLPWPDVLSAKRYSVPVFPYLVVKRRRGIRWWIPLYFEGERDFTVTLVQNAPPNHPIRTALSTTA